VNPVSPDGERLALNRAIAPLAASIAGFCRSKPRAKVGRLALKSLSGSQPRFSYPIAAGVFATARYQAANSFSLAIALIAVSPIARPPFTAELSFEPARH
jgi:hypothetical protein